MLGDFHGDGIARPWTLRRPAERANGRGLLSRGGRGRGKGSGRAGRSGGGGRRPSGPGPRAGHGRVPDANTEIDAPERPERPLSEDALRVWKHYTLSDFQVRAVDAVRAGRNVLVGAPTGAGKTLVAEYAIEEAVRAGRRCIYTSPIKALSNQKFRDFRDDPDVDVGLMTGDVTLHPGAQVLIMTTEILRNTILEDPDSLADVAYVVFDEIHFLDDPERGTVWEEALIFAPSQVRFICLSATVANLRQLGAWIESIRTHELDVIESANRPVPLEHRIWVPGRGLAPPGVVPQPKKKKKSGRDRGGRFGGGRRPRESPALDELFDGLQERGLLPALVFSFSRRDCERLARENAGRTLLDDSQRERMLALQDELVRLFQLDPGITHGELFAMAARGIAYHHAGMLPIHKELVERMFTSGLLRLLFTTETFALGINMPARTVVFHTLRKFDGVAVDWLRTRDYMQMAGRAGRQGIDDSGLVIGALPESDLERAPIDAWFSGRPEPVHSRFRLSYSTLLHLVSDLGRERLHEAWERSFHLFQLQGGARKDRERQSRRQRGHVEARLALLEELGYLEGERDLTARGRIARRINGYELQVTELLFSGALENLPPEALAMVFVAMIFEDRRRNPVGGIETRRYAGIRRHVTQVLTRLAGREAKHRIPEALKLPDWGLTDAALAWCDGVEFAELEGLVDAGPGDVVRTFRMALQLVRQVRRAIDREWDLYDALGSVLELVDRDEVDARRQLELG